MSFIFIFFSRSEFLISRYGERERWDEAAKDLVHQVSDVGAGERVSLQPLSDEAASHWDRACSLSYGTSDKDLVPESAYEVEEGAQDGEHEHRAVPHVAVRAPLPVRAPPRPVRSLGHIGRVLARRARSTRCPVPRDVRRAELLKGFFRLGSRATSRRSVICDLMGSRETSLPVGHVVRSADSAIASMIRWVDRGARDRIFLSYVNNVLKLFTRSFSLAIGGKISYREIWERKNRFLPEAERKPRSVLARFWSADTQILSLYDFEVEEKPKFSAYIAPCAQLNRLDALRGALTHVITRY